MDINFEKDKVTSDFKEAESLENIKSGERLSVIFGKIQRWFSELTVNIQNSGVGKFWKNESGENQGEIFNDYENNVASDIFSHAEGCDTSASGAGSHSEGIRTQTKHAAAHAEGNNTIASGMNSHAEGTNTIANGDNSHAEGSGTVASGNASHAGGILTVANGDASHAGGHGTIAGSDNQYVFGTYNIEDSESKYAFIIGNGTDEARSNALTLDWNGDLWLSGDVTVTDTDGQEISLSALKSELSQTEINVMNVVKNQNNLIQSNNAEHTILHDSLGMQKKNWLKNTHSVGSTTVNGITFTTNADGSVTANGTATADASYNMVVALPPNTSFILSGCPSGGSASTYNIFAIETNSFTQAYRDTGNGAEFNTGSYTEWSFRVRVVNGQTVNDLIFYPMVRNATVSDSEYAPYTDDLQTQINELKAQVAALTGAATVNEEVINNE